MRMPPKAQWLAWTGLRPRADSEALTVEHTGQHMILHDGARFQERKFIMDYGTHLLHEKEGLALEAAKKSKNN